MGMFDRFIKTEDRTLENPSAPMSADDFDKFLALEQMTEKREELQSISQLYSPIRSWDRLLEYKGKMRKHRRREAKQRQR